MVVSTWLTTKCEHRVLFIRRPLVVGFLLGQPLTPWYAFAMVLHGHFSQQCLRGWGCWLSYLTAYLPACFALVVVVGFPHGRLSQQALCCGVCWLSCWKHLPWKLGLNMPSSTHPRHTNYKYVSPPIQNILDKSDMGGTGWGSGGALCFCTGGNPHRIRSKHNHHRCCHDYYHEKASIPLRKNFDIHSEHI